MAKLKKNKLPIEVKEKIIKGWRLILSNKEVILIGRKDRRKLWDVNLNEFACEWNSFFVAPRKKELTPKRKRTEKA